MTLTTNDLIELESYEDAINKELNGFKEYILCEKRDILNRIAWRCDDFDEVVGEYNEWLEYQKANYKLELENEEAI